MKNSYLFDKTYQSQRLLMKESKTSIDALVSLLDEYDSTMTRCKITGNHIIWYDTKIIHPRGSDKLAIRGKSAKSTKKVNGNLYHLSISEEGFRQHFGDEIYKTKNLSKLFNTANTYSKFAFNISDEDYAAKVTSTSVTLANMIDRYGIDVGIEKFNTYKDRQRISNSYEYKREKFGWSYKQFEEFNLSRAITLDNMIKKYGIDKGTLVFNDYCYKQRKSICRNVSPKATRFFNKLVELLPIGDYMYGESNELRLASEHYRSRPYDFSSTQHKFVIEYQGDTIHANPKLFDADDTPNFYQPTLTSYRIWERDSEKKQIAIDNGYQYFEVWEFDDDNNHDETLSSLFNLLTEIIYANNDK